MKIREIRVKQTPNSCSLVRPVLTVRPRTSRPLIFDGYTNNRLTGSFILIEPGTNLTVAAGMLQPPTELVNPEYNDFAI